MNDLIETCLDSFRVLSIATNADDKTLLFEIVFCIVWIGGAVIAVNGQLLGGTISFFQSICLLGYCLFPLNMAAIVNLFIGSYVHIIIKLIYVSVAFVWSTWCKSSKITNVSNFFFITFSICSFHQRDGSRRSQRISNVPCLPLLSIPSLVHYPMKKSSHSQKISKIFCPLFIIICLIN